MTIGFSQSKLTKGKWQRAKVKRELAIGMKANGKRQKAKGNK